MQNNYYSLAALTNSEWRAAAAEAETAALLLLPGDPGRPDAEVDDVELLLVAASEEVAVGVPSDPTPPTAPRRRAMS